MEIYPSILDLFFRSGYKCADLKEDSLFLKDYNEDKENFIKTLTEKQTKDLDLLLHSAYLHHEDRFLNLCRNGIYFGIKLGMEIQNFIDTLEEE